MSVFLHIVQNVKIKELFLTAYKTFKYHLSLLPWCLHYGFQCLNVMNWQLVNGTQAVFQKFYFFYINCRNNTLITLKGFAGHGNYDILSSYP